MGFVAQELAQVLPEVTRQNDEGVYSVDYGRLTPFLVEAVKALIRQNRALSARLDSLENR